MQQATLKLLYFLLFLCTPSSHPPSLSPSLPLLAFSSLPPLEKVPPGFLALKGQKQTGSWQPSNSLGSGYRQREEGGQDRGREAGKKVEGQERKEEKKGQGKVLCETFLKPALTTAPTEDGLRYVHLRPEMQKIRKIWFQGIGKMKNMRIGSGKKGKLRQRLKE